MTVLEGKLVLTSDGTYRSKLCSFQLVIICCCFSGRFSPRDSEFDLPLQNAQIALLLLLESSTLESSNLSLDVREKNNKTKWSLMTQHPVTAPGAWRTGRRRRRRRRSLLEIVHARGAIPRRRRRSSLPAVTGEASTTRCRVAPANTSK